MARSVSPLVSAALRAPHLPVLVLVDLDFADGHLRATNATQSIEWNGYTWLGLGHCTAVGEVREGSDTTARGLALRLSGVPPEYVSLALGEQYRGRAVRLWVAPLTSDYLVLADPVPVWSGRMDTMRVVLGAEATIEVQCESRAATWGRPQTRRWTDAEQQARYPGDRGCAFVAQILDREIVWGPTA